MNTNEVLADAGHRVSSGRKVHPNDHVNASQSSNDVFPTSIHVAATEAVVNDLLPALDHLAAVACERKADEFADVVKSGRTHLMDATPVTLGQEFGGYAAAGPARQSSGSSRSLPRLAELPLGGTAVGTGINTPPGFSAAVIAELAEATGLPFTEAREPLRGAGRPGRVGRGVRAAAHHRGRPDQDLQRPALDGLRPERRAGRDRPARPAAGIVDHAGQGQPGHPRGRR